MSLYVKLAKQAAEEFVTTQELLTWSAPLPAELLRQSACFVTVFENPGRHFRARYGEALPRHATIAQEIVANTVKAITDPTIRPIRRQDLSYLKYQVALVGPLQKISDPLHLDPAQVGLYVRSDQGKTAIILPQRVGIETPDDQIATAIREARIDSHQEAVSMYRFDVTYYDE